MQKKTEEEYRNAISDAVVKYREGLRKNTGQLYDHAIDLREHAVDLLAHTNELEEHTTTLGTHTTEIATNTTGIATNTADIANLHYAPAICVTSVAAVNYAAGSTFMWFVGTDFQIYKNARPYGGKWAATWTEVVLPNGSHPQATSGITAAFDLARTSLPTVGTGHVNIWLSFRGYVTGQPKSYLYVEGTAYNDYSPGSGLVGP